MIDIVSWPARFHVSLEKLTAYVLDPASDDGAAKERYLTSYGFTAERPDVLRTALLGHANDENFIGILVAPFGLKFRFHGPLPAPNGRDARILTVWQVDAGSDGTARFITTRPSRRR